MSVSTNLIVYYKQALELIAHIDYYQVRSAYNRTDYLERRRPMMSWRGGQYFR